MQPYAGLKALVTAAALVVAAVHIWVPSTTVDAITLALFVVAVIPWLQPIFKTIKLPGGFELTLQELKQEVKNATGAAQSAERKADLAVSGLTAQATGQPDRGVESVPEQRMAELSQAYEDIRSKQTAGPTRTQAMTEVIRKMIELAGSLTNFDVDAKLRSTARGQRLAAYAYLYAKPNPTHLAELVQSVTVLEDKPFGQYWGLQAIGLNVGDLKGRSVPEPVVRDLVAYAKRIPGGTDRDYELRRILSRLGLSPETAASPASGAG
jgi:hypothetical protein